MLLALGVWLVNGGDPGTPTGAREGVTSIDDEPGPASVDEASEDVDPASGLPWVDVEELPAQARATLRLIDLGGPFPYDEDGSTFGNYEGVLPEEPRGYYAEYTVDTPGLGHRGPLRLVVGDDGEVYWTEDHYTTFERVRE